MISEVKINREYANRCPKRYFEQVLEKWEHIYENKDISWIDEECGFCNYIDEDTYNKNNDLCSGCPINNDTCGMLMQYYEYENLDDWYNYIGEFIKLIKYWIRIKE